MKIGIVREVHPGERRVAATPDTVKRLMKQGFSVLVETDAGAGSSFPDSQFEQAGAEVLGDAQSVWKQADILLKVRPPEKSPDLGQHEADLLRKGQVLICFLWPAKNQDLIERLRKTQGTVLAIDQIPRITRAQKMDALSSMANIAGYRAVIEAASEFGRFFTGQMTAAGKVPPARVMVIGAGVAGLSAIGAARGLGAIVRAFDTRPVVKEQVESMGAEFLELQFAEDGTGEGGYAKTMSKEFIEAEMALFRQQAREVDIIITTALIPGKPAPLLLPKDVVELMKPGSVIVDLAAEAGGNCEVTRPREVTKHNGVTVIGYVDLPSRLAPTASQLYGSNLTHLLSDMGGAENFKVDHEDACVRSSLVVQNGELLWPPPKLERPPSPTEVKQEAAPAALPQKKVKSSQTLWWVLAAMTLAFFGIAQVAPPSFLNRLTVFVLACFVGWQVVWNVSPALHTPLMSVTNAISGIILVGGMLQISGPPTATITLLAAAAVLVATINIAGGFLVTQRMLKMFQR